MKQSYVSRNCKENDILIAGVIRMMMIVKSFINDGDGDDRLHPYNLTMAVEAWVAYILNKP